MRKPSKVAVAVAGGALAVATAGTAYAYWTTSGSGTGSGATTAGTVDALSFTQTGLTAMYPGDASQPLTVSVRNTSTTESAYVSTVKAFITTDQTGCTGADFLLGGTPAPVDAADARALTWTPADLVAGSAADASSTVQFNNTTGNQDACKGAVVTVHYLAS